MLYKLRAAIGGRIDHDINVRDLTHIILVPLHPRNVLIQMPLDVQFLLQKHPSQFQSIQKKSVKLLMILIQYSLYQHRRVTC